MCHALIIPNGGLVIARHNDICDKIIHLIKQALSSQCVRGEPIIKLVCSRSEEEVRHGGRFRETLGGLSIQGLYEIQMEAIIDVRIGDADT